MSICRCDTCGRYVDTDLEWFGEGDECEACHEERFAKEYAYWKPLYDGERRAGLHSEHTDEGLTMRLREMGGL